MPKLRNVGDNTLSRDDTHPTGRLTHALNWCEERSRGAMGSTPKQRANARAKLASLQADIAAKKQRESLQATPQDHPAATIKRSPSPPAKFKKK